MISMEKEAGNKRAGSDEFDNIDVTSRLMNIVLEMPLEQQLNLLERLDSNGYSGTRKYVRTRLKNPWVVSVDHEEQFLSDNYLIKDIGRCGMFIETNRFFDTGEAITMRFQLPASKKLFKIIGKVVWSRQNGMGVKFLRQIPEV